MGGGARAQVAGRAARSVFDTERGGYFTYPFGNQWSRFGAVLGRTNFEFGQMPALSVKGLHGRLQHFAAVDEPPDELAYFPWSQFLAYDADEMAQGRPSMRVTATWQGTKRPLYFSYGAFEPTQPFQAMHVRDERFIKFWIKQYVRAHLSNPYHPGWWVGADNCTFRSELYGVLDDGGTYIQNVPWDAPYPQNDAEWVSANLYMLSKVKEWSPNIRLACNDIGLNDAQQHRQADFLQHVDGVIREDFWYFAGGGSDWYRNAFYETLSRDIARAAAGKVEVLEIPMSASDATLLRRSWMAYLIIGGDNLFFGPKDSASREINPALWADMRNRLGRPTAPAQSALEPGRTAGFRLYWRACEGGICYLNWTGAAKTVTPPAGRTYYDRLGNQVTSLTLADMSGDYVQFSPTTRVSWPSINPRFPGVVTGPVAITLGMDPAFGTGATIRYTTDGTDPTATSPIYTAPLNLSASATVKARAFKTGMLESFVHAATYSVTSARPTVAFHLATDHGSEFLNRDFPLVKLSHVSSVPITVTYSASGGTAAGGSDYALPTGTLTFPPGEQYRFFPIPILDDAADEPNETIVVSLSNPVNATLGAQSTYTYTIDDNEPSANQAPVVTIPAFSGGSVSLPDALAIAATVIDDGQPHPPGAVVATWSKVAGPGAVAFVDPNALATHVSFAAPGTYRLRCSATDGALLGSAEVGVDVVDSFEAWASRHGVVGELSDADQDGVVTLLEYGLVGDPGAAELPSAVRCSIVRNRLALTFTRDAWRADLTMSVLGADDPTGPWATLATSAGGAPFEAEAGATVAESADGNLRTVEVRDAFSRSDPAHPRRFLRLQVEK